MTHQYNSGPGVPYPCASSELCTTGNAELNHTSGNTTANGDTISQWVVGSWSDLPHRNIVKTDGLIVWELPPAKGLCLLSGYSGKVLKVGDFWVRLSVCVRLRNYCGNY